MCEINILLILLYMDVKCGGRQFIEFGKYGIERILISFFYQQIIDLNKQPKSVV